MQRPSPLNRSLWIGAAACKSVDTNRFYPENGAAVSKEIVSLCASCPVLEPCQEWAVHYEAHGFQGGMTPAQRSRVRAKLNIRLTEPSSLVRTAS
jgi:hypothetical protein